MKVREKRPPQLIITTGKGRLLVQTLLPRRADVRLRYGEELYRYGRRAYPPQRSTGPAPECRVEVSPSEANQIDYFLHVLPATDVPEDAVPPATLEETDREFHVSSGKMTIAFGKDQVSGWIDLGDGRRPLAE